jgi:hypothetical protein
MGFGRIGDYPPAEEPLDEESEKSICKEIA